MLTIDKEEMKKIRDWLSLDAKTQAVDCPFAILSGRFPMTRDTSCRGICHKLFPKSKKPMEGSDINPCPCHVYSKSYVRRKARILLARKGKWEREPRKWERTEKRSKAKDKAASAV